MTVAALRRGWCPSVLRPMQTGDGLLVRLRPLGGVLTPAQAAGVADGAAAFGNGHLDVTSRANLQIRGVREAGLAALRERLRAIGLLEDEGEPEAARNIVTSPLAGLDPTELIDVRPAAAVLGARLANDPAMRPLPAKFGFVIDGGGYLPLNDVPADVRFTAAGKGAFEVRVAGSEVPLGYCAPEAMAHVAAGIVARFQEIRSDDHRMHPVVERLGVAAFAQEAALGSCPAQLGRGTMPSTVEGADALTLRRDVAPFTAFGDPPSPLRGGGSGRPLGILKLGDRAHLGLAPLFGRLEAEDLSALAARARRHGVRDLRLTPWRTLLMTDLDPPAAAALAATLDPSRFILYPADPRLAVAACPGAPACPNATTRTRQDAASLATHLPANTTLHVSGCRKGCAHPGAAPFTLVADAGRYDFIRNGTAQSPPVATGLTLAAAAAMFAERDAEGRAAP